MDRNAYTDEAGTTSGGGTGTTITYYGARTRVNNGSWLATQSPTLSCNSADQYTADNGRLSYPVGMINTDEVALAGGYYYTANSTYYLYNNKNHLNQ